ncbi:MAG: hypothetical protein IJ783_05920 [Kiritimatiellae bacterium]|nr:hypothetical protein [Kiritimatiellia bacterium]
MKKAFTSMRPAILAASAAAAVAAAPAAPLSEYLDQGYAVGTDSAARGFRVFKADATGTQQVVYQWICTQDSAFTGGANNIIYTSDVKIRNGGRTMLLVGATDWAVIDVSGETPVCVRSGHANDGGHGIDLLPDGTVIKADSNSSTAGSLWLMPPDGTSKYAFNLPSCHGVEWDDARQCVWAIGYTNLVKLTYNKTAKTLTEVKSWRLPGTSGHCLDLAEDGKLYTTDWSGVRRFDPDTETFTTLYYLSHPKGISHSETFGDIVELPTPAVYSDGYSANKVCVYPVSGDASNCYEVTPSPQMQMYRARWLSAKPAPLAPVLENAAAAVADSGAAAGASATLSATLAAPGTGAAAATLSVDGAVVRTWTNLSAAQTLSHTVTAAPGTSHSFKFSATDADGDAAETSGSFSAPERPAPAFGPATALVAADGASATLSATLLSFNGNAAPATVSVTFGGETRVLGAAVSAPATFSATVETVPGTSYSFAFSAADGWGVDASATGFFTATTADGWFAVSFADPGYAEGTAWSADLSGVADPRGSWEAEDTLSRLAPATALQPRRVELDGTTGLTWLPEKSSEGAETVTVEGRIRVTAGSTIPPAAEGVAAIGFGVDSETGVVSPYGLANGEWNALAAPSFGLAQDAWVSWGMDLDLGEDGPRVRYRLGAESPSEALSANGSDPWIALDAAPAAPVSRVTFIGDGAVGDFHGTLVLGAPVPILTDADAPALATDGSAIAFGTGETGAATMSLTVVNAVEGVWYVAFASDAVSGSEWVAESCVKADASGTLSLTVSADGPAKFVRLAASTVEYLPGEALGAHAAE